jgi:hypothetical protein
MAMVNIITSPLRDGEKAGNEPSGDMSGLSFLLVVIPFYIYNLFRSVDHTCHPMVHYDVTLPE